eukprot:750229-Hanusia_phi.AAC.2
MSFQVSLLANVPTYNLKITGLTGSTEFVSEVIDLPIVANDAVRRVFQGIAQWQPKIGQLDLKLLSYETITPISANNRIEFNFTIINSFLGQPAPASTIQIQYCSGATTSCNVNVSFTTSTPSSPLFIQNQKFTALNIAQTSSLPGATNKITIWFVTNVPLVAGRLPKMRITNLYPLSGITGATYLGNGEYSVDLAGSLNEFNNSVTIVGTNALDCCSEGQILCGPYAPVISITDGSGTCIYQSNKVKCRDFSCLTPCDEVKIPPTPAVIEGLLQVDCPRFISANISQVKPLLLRQQKT